MNPPPGAESGVECLQSLWLEHKDVLHLLYIVENKTLVQLKHIMESVYDFPVLR